MGLIWGIDLGGTKIEGVILDPAQAFAPICRLRHPTEKAQGYLHIVERIALLLQKMTAETGHAPTALGIGTPGTLDPSTQTLKNSNTVCLNGKPLKKDLEARLGIPITMANDANCFALAETKMGIVAEAYPEAKVVFGVIMGTGVGGGIVIQGQILQGRHGIGGEWGHNFLDESGGPCYCGKVGCVETILAGPASERFYHGLTGEKTKLKTIVSRHESGADPYATQTVERLLHFFGKGLATIVNILDPDVIVLGGGVGNVDLLYTEGVREIEKHVFNPRMETAVLRPRLGDSAGVFGAALLVATSHE
ncbi:MAG: ROK family protein [Bacteroidota bacterium]